MVWLLRSNNGCRHTSGSTGFTFQVNMDSLNGWPPKVCGGGGRGGVLPWPPHGWRGVSPCQVYCWCKSQVFWWYRLEHIKGGKDIGRIRHGPPIIKGEIDKGHSSYHYNYAKYYENILSFQFSHFYFVFGKNAVFVVGFRPCLLTRALAPIIVKSRTFSMAPV